MRKKNVPLLKLSSLDLKLNEKCKQVNNNVLQPQSNKVRKNIYKLIKLFNIITDFTCLNPERIRSLDRF